MAQNYFGITRGLQIDASTVYLTGSAAPGSSGDTTTVPVGSFFTNTSDGSVYVKTTAGSGTGAWSQIATQAYVGSVVGGTTTWLAPSTVRDNTATTLPTGTPASPITVDGVSITNGLAVLFTNLSSTPGRYVYNQTAGTFSQNPATQTAGAVSYVSQGTSARNTYVLNNSGVWELIDQLTVIEQGYQNTFMGKSAGNNMPDYPTHNFISDGDSLTIGIGNLDAQLGPQVSNGTVILAANNTHANITALDTETGYQNTFIGKTVGNSTPTYSSTVYVANTDSLRVAIGKLDAALGPLATGVQIITPTDPVNTNLQALDSELDYTTLYIGKPLGNQMPEYTSTNFILTHDELLIAISKLDAEFGANVSNGTVILAANKVNANITALDTETGYQNTFIGKTAGNNTPTYSSTVYIANGQSLQTAIGNLDSNLDHISHAEDSPTVTTNTIVDEVANHVVEWDIHIIDNTTSTNMYASKVFAAHNGADVSYSEFAVVTLGDVITGLAVTVTFDSGSIQLNVASTTEVYVRTRRVTAF